MLKTNKQIKKIAFIAIFTVFIIPSISFAGGNNDYGGYSLGGWNYGSGSYSQPVSYTSYSYTPSYSSYKPYSYSSSYYPSYSSYYPSYSSSYYPSYSSSYVPSGSNVSVKTDNKATATATATASASSTNVNINNNNVYVYTNPGGNAVVYNPSHVNLTGYCNITPSNPVTGQTVTATAYASGGVGNYTYTWGGDINYSTGPSTQFTSYTTGTKNITVTIRSGQEVVTKTCNVTFENTNNSNLSASCYANPNNANVNQNVNWFVNVNGGNGNYTYSWSGTDGLYGGNQSVNKTYSYTGQKNASVTVYSNGQSTTANCSTYITNGYYSSSVSSISSGTPVSGIFTQKISSGNPISGVYLGDLPATGMSLNWIHYMIAAMLIILSTVALFIYRVRKSLMIS